MKTKRIIVVPFTAEEMKQIGIDLALANQRLERTEDLKKQAMSNYKSEIDCCNAEIKKLAQKLARGAEERTVDCDVIYHTPEAGKKTIRRCDNGEILNVFDMSEDELQDLIINGLGENDGYFVFRDKANPLKIYTEDDLEKAQKKGEFTKIAEYTERDLIDNKPENTECKFLVKSQKNGKTIFVLYHFAGSKKGDAE